MIPTITSKLIFLMEPLPNTNKVFSTIMQQERHTNNFDVEKKVLNTTKRNYKQEEGPWRGHGR